MTALWSPLDPLEAIEAYLTGWGLLRLRQRDCDWSSLELKHWRQQSRCNPGPPLAAQMAVDHECKRP